MARKYKPDHLLMASTSSVYGSNKDMPLHETQKCDTPMSFYAATDEVDAISKWKSLYFLAISRM